MSFFQRESFTFKKKLVHKMNDNGNPNITMSTDLSGDGWLGAVCAREGEVDGPDPDHEAHPALPLYWSISAIQLSSWSINDSTFIKKKLSNSSKTVL